MGAGRVPGPECSTRSTHRIDSGTLCRQASPRPGPLTKDQGSRGWPQLTGLREMGAKWMDAAEGWIGRAGDTTLGHSKSLMLTLIDLLPVKQASPFSTRLLKHYVERSGDTLDLGDIPVEWQDWIVKTTRGRAGKHRDLNPYNSGLFDLRNSLGHFDVDVQPGQGTKKLYVISDTYQFGFTPNDKQQKGRHGFPVGRPSEWQLAAVKKLLPTAQYQNPGGFKERWEIRTSGKETILMIPQQYLAEQGKQFVVTGRFER